MLGKNAEVSMLAIPAFPVREKPVCVLLKCIAEIIARDFKSAGYQRKLLGSVAGFSHLKNHFLMLIS